MASDFLVPTGIDPLLWSSSFQMSLPAPSVPSQSTSDSGPCAQAGQEFDNKCLALTLETAASTTVHTQNPL
jgi:hypothetical protein